MDCKLILVKLVLLYCLTQVICLKRFELKVIERGLKLKQTLSFDVDANLQIVDVPAHFDRVATKYVKDLNNKLQLQVRWLDRECLVSKILQPQDSEVQIRALENQDLSAYVNYENATTVNILEIEGPDMDHSEIPNSLRSYCPEDFKAKAIHLIDERNIAEEDEEGLLIKDPDMKFDVKNHDPAPHVTDTLHFLSRRKRDVCRDANNNELPGQCQLVHVYCPDHASGCPAEDAYYHCNSDTDSSHSCEYILTCSTAGGPDSEQCLMHITSRGRSCRMCCKYYDCGRRMPRCADTAHGDCFHEQAAYEGYQKGRVYLRDSAQDCQKKCQRKNWCQHFNFRMEEGDDEDGECELQTQKGNFTAKPGKTGYVTGPRICP